MTKLRNRARKSGGREKRVADPEEVDICKEKTIFASTRLVRGGGGEENEGAVAWCVNNT